MGSIFSLGITFIPQYPPETLVEVARYAESSGFDIIWLYEDCYYAGAFTSAATILASTHTIKVGIGILPVTVRNPLFTAMEISTLGRLYPGRFIAGFGHGYELWMKQIGAYPQSTIKALEETVSSVRSLLSGRETTRLGSHVHLDHVQLLHPPLQVPPLYIGAIREKTLQLAGRFGDGTLLSVLSSPAYVRWAIDHIKTGSSASAQEGNKRTVFVACKVSQDGYTARSLARHWVAECIQNGGPHLGPLGIAEEAPKLIQKYKSPAEAADKLPDSWINALTASGTPDQATETVKNLIDTGIDSLVLAPIDPDPSDLQKTIKLLLPSIMALNNK